MKHAARLLRARRRPRARSFTSRPTDSGGPRAPLRRSSAPRRVLAASRAARDPAHGKLKYPLAVWSSARESRSTLFSDGSATKCRKNWSADNTSADSQWKSRGVAGGGELIQPSPAILRRVARERATRGGGGVDKRRRKKRKKEKEGQKKNKGKNEGARCVRCATPLVRSIR